MGLAYFGSDGVYHMDSTNASAQMNTANVNAYTNSYTYGATATSTSSSLGLIAGVAYGGIGSNISQALGPLPDMVTKQAKAIKRSAKGILSKLREEIDGWHGDILERCPA